MDQFLLHCAGINLEILEKCPTQKTKYTCIGGTVLATATIASVSFGFAIYTVYGHVVQSIIAGMIWGGIIFNLDRLFLASVRIHKNVWKEMLTAVPRLFFAALISFAISKPLELSIFRTEIEAEMTSARTIAYAEAKSRLDNTPAFRNEIKSLEDQNEAARQHLADVGAARDTAYSSFIAEAEGTAGSKIVGRGPVFAEKKAEAEKLERNLQTEKREVEQQISRNEARLAEINAIKNNQLVAMEASQRSATGMLGRIRALHVLSERDPAVKGTSLVVTLLLLSLEICPLALKLLGAFNHRRPYEQLLDALEAEETAMAEIAVHEAETHAATEKEITKHQEKVRLEEQRKANANILRTVVDGQEALAQDAVRSWNDQQRELLQQDPDQFFHTK